MYGIAWFKEQGNSQRLTYNACGITILSHEERSQVWNDIGRETSSELSFGRRRGPLCAVFSLRANYIGHIVNCVESRLLLLVP